MQGVHDFFITGKGIQDNGELNRLGPWIKFIFQRIRLWEEIRNLAPRTRVVIRTLFHDWL